MARRVAGIELVLLLAILPPCALSNYTDPAPDPLTGPSIPVLEVTEFTLTNGLRVVLHEDHKSPLVSVNVIYKVGSKDEPAGRTGFAHLFEHIMFEGSEHSDSNYSATIYQYITDARGTTSEDETVYTQTFTRNALERVLWLEADRMGYLLGGLTFEKFRRARASVMNERRESLDDWQLGELHEAMRNELYPPGHPYRHSPYGLMPDLTQAQLNDFAPFTRRFYSPANAVLCVAGDFDPVELRRWIEHYFGRLDGGSAPARRPACVPHLAQAKRIELSANVCQAHAELIWPTVPVDHPDEAALDVLASILGGSSKSSRIFRALLYDRQAASAASASHPTYQLAGYVQMDLTARVGQPIEAILPLVDAELERMRRDGPTAPEVRRAKMERRRLLLNRLGAVSNKASLLCEHAVREGSCSRLSRRAGQDLRGHCRRRHARCAIISHARTNRAHCPSH